MRIEQLQYLVNVAESGSINLAAENNYISQQSISEAIRKLEQEFGIDLLERSYKGVHLTEAGKGFVEKAKVILNNIEELKKEYKYDKSIGVGVSTLTGNLSIVVSTLLDNRSMYNVLAAFNKEQPEVDVIIEQKDFRNVILGVAANKADIGIIIVRDSLLAGDELSSTPFNKEVFFRKIRSDKMFICVSKMSPLANRKSISYKEALKYPMVMYTADISENSWYINYLKSHGKTKRLIVTSSSDVFRETIVRGLAIGGCTFSYLKGNPFFREEIIPLSISDDANYSYGWILPKNRDLSETAKEFIRTWQKLEVK